MIGVSAPSCHAETTCYAAVASTSSHAADSTSCPAAAISLTIPASSSTATTKLQLLLQAILTLLQSMQLLH